VRLAADLGPGLCDAPQPAPASTRAAATPNSWEAAVFDHLQAVVQTIGQRLQRACGTESRDADNIGGSTYSFDLWPGHPLESEIKGQLATLRARLGELRQRLDAHNKSTGLPPRYQQVVTYVGQCILEREPDCDE